MNRKSPGFTTVELLVAIAITMTIFGFIYTAHYFSLKMLKLWQEKNQLTNEASFCMKSLSSDLIDAAKIIRLDTQNLTFRNIYEEQVEYYIRDGNLYRNGMQLNSAKVMVVGLSFHGSTNTEDGEDAKQLISELEEGFMNQDTVNTGKMLIEIKLTLVMKGKRITVRSALYPRNLAKNEFARFE